MRPYLQEKLGCDDRVLFTQCACHVFADELATRLMSRGFHLSRLADLNCTSQQMQALHVFLTCNDTMVDVEGLQPVGTFLDLSRTCRLEHGGPVPKFEIHPCTSHELFTAVPHVNEDERGVHNKWAHLIDPEFLVVCRSRAEIRISISPTLYGLC